MSNDKKIKDDPSTEGEDAKSVDEISEEQLESVSGGILIGLNQPSFKDMTGHKDLKGQIGGIATQTPGADGSFKFHKLS